MSVWTHAVSGMAGGVFSMALLYPLESIRIRLQVVKGGSKKSLWEAISAVVRQEGARGLYQGLESSLIAVAISQGVYFYWYTALKRLAFRLKGSMTLDPVMNVAVASAAGIVNVVLTNPIWVVSTQLALKKESIAQCFRRIFKESGLAGLYAGFVSALLLVSNPIIQFVCYEQILKFLRKSGRASTLGIFIAGAISKAIATTATYPLLVIKSRKQVSTGKEKAQRQHSVLRAVSKMIKEEGFTSLYSGLQAKLVQSVLNSAFMFLAYEKILGVSIAVSKNLAAHKRLAN